MRRQNADHQGQNGKAGYHHCPWRPSGPQVAHHHDLPQEEAHCNHAPATIRSPPGRGWSYSHIRDRIKGRCIHCPLPRQWWSKPGPSRSPIPGSAGGKSRQELEGSCKNHAGGMYTSAALARLLAHPQQKKLLLPVAEGARRPRANARKWGQNYPGRRAAAGTARGARVISQCPAVGHKP